MLFSFASLVSAFVFIGLEKPFWGSGQSRYLFGHFVFTLPFNCGRAKSPGRYEFFVDCDHCSRTQDKLGDNKGFAQKERFHEIRICPVVVF